jgi:translation initiation factor IF-3
MKELRFTWRTATHDFNFKVKHAREFLEEGNKVKATVMFRGREITHQEVGKELLDKFIEAVSDLSKVDSLAKLEGKKLSVVLSPDKTKAKKQSKEVIDKV